MRLTRAEYARRRRLRLCVDCPAARIASVGSDAARCRGCAGKRRTRGAVRRKLARALAVCVACRREPVAGDSARCVGCNERAATLAEARGNATREARARDDACVGCGAQLVGDRYVRCAECRRADADKHAALVATRIAAGLCTRCGKTKPVRGTVACKKCRARRKAREADV